MNDKEKQLLTTGVGTKGNVRAITIADHNLDHLNFLLDVVKTNYDFYAYIIHDKDSDTDPHVHILAMCKGGTTLKNHCERFQEVVPANFVCKVKNHRAMAKYLIHKGFPDKFQYDPKEVVTNNLDYFYQCIRDGSPDSLDVWRDFSKLRRGMISIQDFLEIYRAEFSSMPFYQKLSLYHKLQKDGFEENSGTHHGF